jgi:3-hydroxybutyryl-CoA dehydratase
MILAGDLLPEQSIEVRAESMPIWAAALRDPNPIHVDPEATRAAGLGDRVINQGPANVGYLVNALLAAFPEAWIDGLQFRFLDSVRAGDVATAGGRITTVTTTEQGLRIECILELNVQGKCVLSGTASAILPRPSDAISTS